MSCFSFYLFFSSTKSENRRVQQVLPRRRAGTSGREEVMEKRGRRVKKCVLMYLNTKIKKIKMGYFLYGY
jgi:hypothetical protein